MRITLITTGSPTTNPRLVKEVDALQKAGHAVKVICCFSQLWAEPFDKEISDKYAGTFVYCGGNPITERLKYFKTRLRHALCHRLFEYTRAFGVAENAISRTHDEALHIAKKIKTELFIAHNLGALPAAVIAAKYHQAKVGYDAEDMHSGQFTSPTSLLYLLNKHVEEKYFTQIDYFTAASPLIAYHYQRVYPFLQPVVINNVFPQVTLTLKRNYRPGAPLKLFWFSQNVGPDRGLEDIICAIAESKLDIILHLLGNCAAANQSALAELATVRGLRQEQVRFHQPIAANELFEFAIQFDIGMATETASTLNRDICLTNKIFTYLQSGLAIVASDTQAQKRFFNQYATSGKIYRNGDVKSLAECLIAYASDAEHLYHTRLTNYKLGQDELNWELESLKFINVVKQIKGE